MKQAMKGFAFALEHKFTEEIKNVMGYLNLPRSERYRTLTILGLDEYAISGSELRKKKFPIKEEIGKAFTVMLPSSINKEIMDVKEKRNQIKKLAIRYIVLLGFEKWKRDNPHPVKVEPDPKIRITTLSPPETYNGPGIITDGNIVSSPENINTTVPFEFHKNQMAPDPKIIAEVDIDSIGNSNQDKFKILMDLIKEFDFKITIENNK